MLKSGLPPLLSNPALLRQVLKPHRRAQIGEQVQSEGWFVIVIKIDKPRENLRYEPTNNKKSNEKAK